LEEITIFIINEDENRNFEKMTIKKMKNESKNAACVNSENEIWFLRIK